MTRQLWRRGRWKFAANSDGPLNLRENGCGIEQQHADWREDKRLGLLGKKSSGCQRTAGLVAIARAGSALRMFLRAAILFAQPACRINQTARGRWQSNERQHQRDHCLDTLHGQSNTTAVRPEQCGRLDLGGVGTHVDFNSRKALAMTTSVAPVSVRSSCDLSSQLRLLDRFHTALRTFLRYGLPCAKCCHWATGGMAQNN